MSDIRYDITDETPPQEWAFAHECRQIKSHLGKRVTFAEIEKEHPWYLVYDPNLDTLERWQEVVEDWQAFKAAFQEGDEVWTFDTTETDGVFCLGKEGFAILRQGQVMTWLTTAINC